MDCTISPHPMAKAIQPKNHFAKRATQENERENNREEVCHIGKCLNNIEFFFTEFIKIAGPSAPSPTRTNATDLLQKESNHLGNPSHQPIQTVQVRKSPKKRPLKRYTIVSSSSSTESLTSDTKGNEYEACSIETADPKSKSHKF